MFTFCLAALLTYPLGDLELKDGDRVVLVGGALIEREQQYGHLEVLFHGMFPERKFTVRNLGWSGDTVWGEARACFGTPVDGYKALVEQVKATKPTVLILGYGTSEAFAGKAGVPRFVEQYKKLLKDCVPEGCRLIFLTIPHPKHPQVSPRFAQKEYDAAIKTIAQEHQGILVDAYQLFHPWDSRPMSDDGLLPNALGNQKLAQYIGFAMTREERERADKERQDPKPVPAGEPVDTEPLRQLILKKNELFFNQYRPQNNTYLFLFRKHEQGNNAAEIPQFTPLIEDLDKQINAFKWKK